MIRILAVSVMLLGLAAGDAQAQFYPRPYGYGYGPPGGRCDAFFRTPYGPRRFVCPMGVAKPVGAHCECPLPDGFPAQGRVIP